MPTSRCTIRWRTPSPTPFSISIGTARAFPIRCCRSRSTATAAICCTPAAASARCSRAARSRRTARPALAAALALHAGRRGDRRDLCRLAVARRTDRLVELVALLPVADQRLSVARSPGRSRAVRGARPRRLRALAAAFAQRYGSGRSARDAELDDAGRRDGKARPQAGRARLRRDLDLRLGEVLRLLPGVISLPAPSPQLGGGKNGGRAG